MDSGDKIYLRGIKEVDREGDYHKNGSNNPDDKRNDNNNCYSRSAGSQSDRRPEGAPLVGWRNDSPTICPSSVQNSAYVDLMQLDPTHEVDPPEAMTIGLSSERNAANIGRAAPLVHEGRLELETVQNERVRDSIDFTTSLNLKNDCSITPEEKKRKKPKVPDGGWGWMVVLASLVISMIADGISFSFGLLYIEFLHEFGASKSKTAWIGSLFMAVPLLSGPIMSGLVDRYGCRRMTIAGGLISGLGFILSSFAKSVEVMYLTFGVIAGLGLGLCYVTAVVSIAYWFDKKRTLAMGLGACGTGIGTFVYAPMTTYFIQEYGWRGTCLLLAGTFFNMIVAGAVMRDPEWWILEQRKQDQAAPKKSRPDDARSEASPSDEFPGVDELRRLLRNDHLPEYFVQSLNTTTAAAAVDGGAKGKTSFRSVVNLPTFVKRSEKVSGRFAASLLSLYRSWLGAAETTVSVLMSK